jgi:hypothetical protein
VNGPDALGRTSGLRRVAHAATALFHRRDDGLELRHRSRRHRKRPKRLLTFDSQRLHLFQSPTNAVGRVQMFLLLSDFEFHASAALLRTEATNNGDGTFRASLSK